jgi:catechol 2,3-dioxygenase-like lactoylglutathione lyase family enzyme
VVTMTNGGAARIYVSDLRRAVKFYTETLGLRLRAGYQDHWASIDAGNGFVLALHSVSNADGPSAGKSGSISVGFEVINPLEGVVANRFNFRELYRGDQKSCPANLSSSV